MSALLRKLASAPLLLLLLLTPAAVAHATPPVVPEPQFGQFLVEDLSEARIQGLASKADHEGANGLSCLDGEEPLQTLRIGQPFSPLSVMLNSQDVDACHYARGTTLVFHVFIDHNLGSWSTTERNAAAAKAALAKQWYADEAPADANMDFDNLGGTGYYYYQTASLNFDGDTLSGAEIQTVLASFGFTDDNGDGNLLDEFAFYWQNWNGGWDNVILVFQPADATGRASANLGISRITHYTDDAWTVWRHEMGHVFGSCDEYSGDGCNSCATCHGTYHITAGTNGNCQGSACGDNQSCVMINNVDAHCTFTEYHWGWDDTDSNGLLDTMKRQTTLGSFVNINEMFHNGYYRTSNTTNGFVAAQQWDTWSVFAVRPAAGSDHDLRLYHDNNHNFLLATSSQNSSAVDFIVGDYNHARPGNEHMQVNLQAGVAGVFNATWESGTGTLYPNGAYVGTQTWTDYNVVRMYEVPLFAGEEVSFTLDVQTAGLDMGFALYKSNGAAYFASRSGAVAAADVNGAGANETFTYTVPTDDVYGLVVWSNNELAGTFDIRIGTALATLTDDVSFLSGIDLRLFDYDPVAGYWGVVATRPTGTSDADLSLFSDANFTTLLEESAYTGQSVDFIAADYNHASSAADYLRVNRDVGADTHRTEFEQGSEILDGFESFAWEANDVADIWDTFLTAGVPYFFREYHSTLTGFDSAIYLVGSTDGDYYQSRNDLIDFSNSRAMNEGGEWFAYTPTISDWYGLVVFGNEENAASSGSLWMGRQETLSSDLRVTRTEEVQFDVVPPTAGYWNVIAARPGGTDVANIALYEDSGYGTLATTDFSTGVTFVVGDWNHNAQPTIYPRIRRSTGTGPVDIEFEGDADAIVPAPATPYTLTSSWSTQDVAEVYDLWIPGGVGGGKDVAIMVESLTGDLDLGIELFRSNGAEYFAGRNSGVASANALGAGGTEGLVYHATTSDYYGLVVFNNNDNAGTWRLTIYDPNVLDAGGPAVPTELALASWPNPARGDATLSYDLPKEGEVSLEVFDLQGRLVRSLARGRQPAGRHSVRWDGRDGAGQSPPAGVYLARIRANGQERQLKLVRAE
ncbi:MAG: T9SS type A sorting domain-containing protein [Candidatus Eisenbacteria bacterium]|nr:T9SS type A sorting domain-containing protein [Candidatus Eisenbacteria bacterium]